MKTIAGRLLRELERKLPAAVGWQRQANFALYRRVLNQPADRGEIYSLHEPQVHGLSKGKEHEHASLAAPPAR